MLCRQCRITDLVGLVGVFITHSRASIEKLLAKSGVDEPTPY